MAVPLALDVAFQALTAALYAFVGWTISRRHIAGEAQFAFRAFAFWWVGLSGLTLVGVLNTALYVLGVRDVALYLTITHFLLIVLCAACWGLTYYLAFLFSGDRRWLTPTIVYWIVFYVGLVYLVTALHPIGVKQVGNAVQIDYGSEIPRSAGLTLGIALVAPILVGAIAYARLFFRVDDITQRYRIGLVSMSLVGWFFTSLLGSVVTVGDHPLSQQPWWTYVARIVGFVASVVILMAYRPPSWIRHRFGIRGLDEPAA